MAIPKRIEKLHLREFRIEEDVPKSCSFFVIGPPHSGKCYAKGTEILLHDGAVSFVEHVKPGMFLLGDDGAPRLVVSTTSGVGEMYKIVPDDRWADSFTVNGDHILVLSDGIREYHITVDEYRSRALTPPPAPLCLFQTAVDSPHLYTTAKRESMLNEAIAIGTRQKDGIAVIVTESERLARDVVFLARSLGYAAYHDIETVYINMSDRCLHRLYGFTIVPIGRDAFYGFQIDLSTNQRHLLKDFTVAHNSTLIENLVYYNRHRYPVAKAFIGNEDGYNHWCSILPPLYVMNHYDADEHRRFNLRQRMLDAQKHPMKNAVCIMDDIGSDKKIFKEKRFRGSFLKGSQHWDQLFILATQAVKDIPEDVRLGATFIAIGNVTSIEQRDKIYDVVGSSFGNKKRFYDVLDQVCGDHTFLIIRHNQAVDRPEECLFWYQTKVLPKWKFGSKEYREWGRDRMNVHYREEFDE